MENKDDFLRKKNRGVYYTPEVYAKKSLELVRQAIRRVPDGNDYVIIDRCAGTGNLEVHMTDEELSHCILSTIEYAEYQVLQELFGSKARHIVSPMEEHSGIHERMGTDALSREYVECDLIRQYVDNPDCTIILFENPPYSETTSIEHQRTKLSKTSVGWKKSFVVQEMKKEVKSMACTDLANAFIWSAFKFYLRQDTDSYIVFSPVKYWKAQHLITKEFLAGFAFNRKQFHTSTAACVMCALWTNRESDQETLYLDGYNIDTAGKLSKKVVLPVKKVHERFSNRYYEKPKFQDVMYDGILTGLDGLEATKEVKRRLKPIYSREMLGYLVADSVGFDNPDSKSSLLVAGRYNGNGCYLRRNHYLEKLPMFAASRYITYNREWTERARIMKSADGADRYFQDVSNGKLTQFLLKCLLFTCLEKQNHMRTFTGSDGRFYRNELCLDGTNGETIALHNLASLQQGEKEKALLKQWETVLQHAKACEEYDAQSTYGIYQIITELDTAHKDDATGRLVWNHETLHSEIKVLLKKYVREYYFSEIVPTLLAYEFIK